MTDTTHWRTLDFNDEYAAGMAWTRVERMLREDPFAGMLNSHALSGILASLFGPKARMLADADGRIIATTREQTRSLVHAAFGQGACSKMWSSLFVDHVADICVVAMFYGHHEED